VKSLKVKLKERSYPIIIGNNSLSQLIKKINSLPISKCLLIIDKNVEKYHSPYLRKNFADINCKTFKYVFSASERNKSLKQAEKIYQFLSNNYFDRNSVIVSIGGGITGDISGYVASTFMRGINLYQVPTTLLSMVDSAVGGKTGVNFINRKNLIGTFYQPHGVFLYDEFLKSLPKTELLSGAGEIFKYSFLADEKNYLLLKNSLRKITQDKTFNLEKTILNCLRIKSDVVKQDEMEISGLRKILNLGHTYAHAFEVQSNYKLKHGQAVIGGIYCSLFLSESLGYISKKTIDKFLNDFKFFKINKLLYSLDPEKIYLSMLGDKKNLSGKIKFVLLEDIGNIIIDVSSEKFNVIDSIKRMQKSN
jgi:3-dehydroquinate synthase